MKKLVTLVLALALVLSMGVIAPAQAEGDPIKLTWAMGTGDVAPIDNAMVLEDPGRFGRIFCLFFMARKQFSHKSSALTASVRVRQPPNAFFVLSCQPTAPRLSCGCRRGCKGFPSALYWP